MSREYFGDSRGDGSGRFERAGAIADLERGEASMGAFVYEWTREEDGGPAGGTRRDESRGRERG